MLNATTAARASLSIATTLAPDVASCAEALLTSGSTISAASNVTGNVRTTVLPAPAGMTACASDPLPSPAAPLTVPQVAVPAATQVAAPLSMTPDGSGSSSATSSASESPVLPNV